MSKQVWKSYDRRYILSIRVLFYIYLLYIITNIMMRFGILHNYANPNKHQYEILTVFAHDICYLLQLILIIIFQTKYKFSNKDINTYFYLNILFFIPESIYFMFLIAGDFPLSFG